MVEGCLVDISNLVEPVCVLIRTGISFLYRYANASQHTKLTRTVILEFSVFLITGIF